MDLLSFVVVATGMLAALAIIAWAIVAAVRARHDIPRLSGENAQLRHELGTVKDRLATVESIVTDGGYRLGTEIERLRAPGN